MGQWMSWKFSPPVSLAMGWSCGCLCLSGASSTILSLSSWERQGQASMANGVSRVNSGGCRVLLKGRQSLLSLAGVTHPWDLGSAGIILEQYLALL